MMNEEAIALVNKAIRLLNQGAVHMASIVLEDQVLPELMKETNDGQMAMQEVP